MMFTKEGTIIDGDIAEETQKKYDLIVFFTNNPVAGYTQLVDLAEYNTDASEDIQEAIKAKFAEALLLDKYDESMLKNIYDHSREVLYQYWLRKLK